MRVQNITSLWLKIVIFAVALGVLAQLFVTIWLLIRHYFGRK